MNPSLETRNAEMHANTQHALAFALCHSHTFIIEDESADPDARMGGRTYVFLVNDDRRTWHGYVTPETLAVLRHLAGSVIL